MNVENCDDNGYPDPNILSTDCGDLLQVTSPLNLNLSPENEGVPIEPMLVGEQICKLNDDFRNNVMDDVLEPNVGMSFTSAEDAYLFYKEYSCKVGFGVTRRSSHSFHGFKYHVTFCCNKNRPPVADLNSEGFSLRNRGSTATGCRARIVVRGRMLNGNWVIEESVLEHNHDLFPDSVRLMRCHRSLPAFVRKQLKVNEFSGLAQNKSISSIFTQAGGVSRCMFTERDMRNYISEYRRLQFGKGDAAALMKYFHEQQVICPNFFYCCDVGDDGHLKSVFWADGRSRAAYKYFGDVITFDTTYLTNRYRMPFAVFVGVNHHGQSILLGCALLANELSETYLWLFETFLSCMGGKCPDAVVTDQCASICGAISVVFPATRHRLCLWQIMKNVPEKLGGVKDRDEIMKSCSRIVYECLSESEFDKEWLHMLSKYQFGANYKWFKDLFDMRHSWVPAFVRSEFWAGMSTTQRSEGMNAFFDGYVNSRTSLKCFVEKYSLALFSKWEKEKQEDFRSSYRRVRLVSNLNIESEFAQHYTHRMFYLFQKEVKMLIGCSCYVVCFDSEIQTFSVQDSSFPGSNHVVRFIVASSEYECDCKLFEFWGIVCRHALVVYKQVGVNSIPRKYVLDRWRKDFVRSHVEHNVSLPPVFNDVDTYDNLLKSVQQVVLELVEVGCRDKEFGQELKTGIFRFGRELLKKRPVDLNVTRALKLDELCDTDDVVIKDPIVVNSKGRPRNRRFKSSVEKTSTKRTRSKKAKIKECLPQIDCVAEVPDSTIGTGMSATELLMMVSSGL